MCPSRPNQDVPNATTNEYERRGVCNIFMFFEPKASWRHVDLRERRTACDFAQQMRKLADEHYPEAEKIRVVLDNLNTHMGAALYEAFKPQEARGILRRLEFHYTPKRASWLNQVEIESSRCSLGSASGESASPTKRYFEERWQRGSESATKREQRWIGASRRRMHARS